VAIAALLPVFLPIVPGFILKRSVVRKTILGAMTMPVVIALAATEP
jgi:hypothetical protein